MFASEVQPALSGGWCILWKRAVVGTALDSYQLAGVAMDGMKTAAAGSSSGAGCAIVEGRE